MTECRLCRLWAWINIWYGRCYMDGAKGTCPGHAK